MAVISCSEKTNEGSFEVSKDKIKRTYKRVFVVICSSPLDDALVVKSASGLPQLGMQYVSATSVDLFARCKKVDPTRVSDSNLAWEVTVTYDTETDEVDEEETPFDQAATWTVGFEKTKESTLKDLEGTTIANTIGDPLQPALEIDKSLIKLRAEKKVPTFNLAFAYDYLDKINDAVWNGFVASSVKIDNIDASQFIEDGYTGWKLTWNFSVKFQQIDDVWVGGWHPYRVVNAGYRCRKTGASPSSTDQADFTLIRDRYNTPLPNQSFLDADGFLTDADNIHWLEFRLYESRDFTGIPE